MILLKVTFDIAAFVPIRVISMCVARKKTMYATMTTLCVTQIVCQMQVSLHILLASILDFKY